jgi:hypothetical protein
MSTDKEKQNPSLNPSVPSVKSVVQSSIRFGKDTGKESEF